MVTDGPEKRRERESVGHTRDPLHASVELSSWWKWSLLCRLMLWMVCDVRHGTGRCTWSVTLYHHKTGLVLMYEIEDPHITGIYYMMWKLRTCTQWNIWVGETSDPCKCGVPMVVWSKGGLTLGYLLMACDCNIQVYKQQSLVRSWWYILQLHVCFHDDNPDDTFCSCVFLSAMTFVSAVQLQHECQCSECRWCSDITRPSCVVVSKWRAELFENVPNRVYAIDDRWATRGSRSHLAPGRHPHRATSPEGGSNRVLQHFTFVPEPPGS